MQTEELPTSFSSKPNEWVFSIDNTSYVLREAKEDAVIAYKDISMRHLQFSEREGGMAGQLSGGAEADAFLVSKCLFRIDGEGETRKELPVPPTFVRNLPHRISSRLYKWVKSNSGMLEEEETIEVLEKRIKSDQSKLARLKKGETEGKDSCSSTDSI